MTEVWHDLWAGSPTPIREGGIPRRANLVKKAENWKWSSAWRRKSGSTKQKKLLSTWPVSEPRGYLNWLNQAQTEDEEEAIESSITKGNPYGGDSWVDSVVKKFNLGQTLRKVGRPTKNGG